MHPNGLAQLLLEAKVTEQLQVQYMPHKGIITAIEMRIGNDGAGYSRKCAVAKSRNKQEHGFKKSICWSYSLRSSSSCQESLSTSAVSASSLSPRSKVSPSGEVFSQLVQKQASVQDRPALWQEHLPVMSGY